MINMDPNVYVAYLCFTENNSNVRKKFKLWSHKTNPHAPLNYSDLRWAIDSIKEEMRWQAKRAFLYEAEMAWKCFDVTKFMEFLDKYRTG